MPVIIVSMLVIIIILGIAFVITNLPEKDDFNDENVISMNIGGDYEFTK